MTKEALRLALGALQRFIKYDYNETPFDGKDVEGAEAITAIKAALAQPEQEPVAWMVYTQEGQSVYVTDNPTDLQESQRALPLYTTPPQRKPLTDEEIYSLADSLEIWNEDDEEWILDPNTFARAIEAKLKELNT